MIVLWNSAEMTVQLTLIDGDKRTDYEWAAERNLARDMLAYLRDRLAENGASFADISGIGVFRGPGSFTGLRIGLAVLNTIAHEPDDSTESCLKKSKYPPNPVLRSPPPAAPPQSHTCAEIGRASCRKECRSRWSPYH